MANEDKPAPDCTPGLKTLANPVETADHGNTATSEYGKSPNPGNVITHCKNGCNSAIDFGFVIDMVTWIEGFKPQEFICPTCKLKALYSRSDLVPIPAKK